MFNLGINVIEQGLIFGLMALGVYITYRILDFPDLSVDGTIVLGSAISSALIISGYNPILATLIALLGGALAGLFTGVLHVYLKINNLLSGILVMIGLYSINLRIMGKANLSLFRKVTIFTLNKNPLNITIGNRLIALDKIIIIIIIVVIIKLLLDIFLKTKLGMLLRVTGDNPYLVTNLGKNIGLMKILGLMISNALVALSGSILAQYQNFADITNGLGTIVLGLAAVIIGEAFFKNSKFLKTTTMVIIGSILYKACQVLTLLLGLSATDFKLISALILIIILGYNNNKQLFSFKKYFKNKGEVNVTSY